MTDLCYAVACSWLARGFATTAPHDSGGRHHARVGVEAAVRLFLGGGLQAGELPDGMRGVESRRRWL